MIDLKYYEIFLKIREPIDTVTGSVLLLDISTNISSGSGKVNILVSEKCIYDIPGDKTIDIPSTG